MPTIIVSFAPYQFPGPNDEGLKFMLERSQEGTEGIGKTFYSIIPGCGIGLPRTMKALLKTSGIIADGTSA